jgi:hypothetical protein
MCPRKFAIKWSGEKFKPTLVLGFWLFLFSFAHGDFKLAIITAGLNAPIYLLE